MFKRIDTFIRSLNHRRIDFFRAVLLRLSKAVFDHQKNIITHHDLVDHRILVLRLDDKLGDGIVSTGFLKSIKNFYPNTKLIVLTGPQTLELYRSLDFVDEVILCKKGLYESLRVFAILRKSTYSFIVNTSHILTPRVVFIISQLKALKKFGFLNNEYKLFSRSAEYNELSDHVTRRYQALLSLMGVSRYDLNYKLKVDSDFLKRNQQILNSLAHKKIIVLNSFAGARLRNFTQETTMLLVKKIVEQFDVNVVSVAQAGDHLILKKWIEDFQHPNWKHFEEISNFSDNLALTSCADLVITPDTAWVHIASALNIKVLAVYRSDEYSEEKNSLIWAPYSEAKCEVVLTVGDTPDKLNNINNFSIEELMKRVHLLLKY